MNAIIAALLADPAILALNAGRLASDIRARFGVCPQVAYAAIHEAIEQAESAGVMPAEITVPWELMEA